MRLNRDFYIIAVFFLLVFLILSQIGISYTLNKSRPRITQYLTDNFQHSFKLERISFNYLRGIRIKGAAIFYGSQRTPNQPSDPDVLLKDASISIRIFPLIFKRTLAIHINIKEGVFLVNKQEGGVNLQVIFSDICKKSAKIKPRIYGIFNSGLSVSFETAKFVYADNASSEKNIYILIENSRLRLDRTHFKFDGNIEFNYRLPKEAYISRFFTNRQIKQQLKCSILGNIVGDDLAMDLIVLDIGKDQVIGTGVSKGFVKRNPLLNVSFMHYTLSLENIASLKENFNARGDIYCSFKLNGLMDKPKIGLVSSLYYCDLKCALPNGELFDIKNLRGEMEYRDNRIKLSKISLDLNAVPLNIESSADISDEAGIKIKLSLPNEFLAVQSLPLENLEAIFEGKLKNTLAGDLNINALYLRKNYSLNMQAYFKNIEFDYKGLKDKYLKADIIELTKKSATKTQKLNFANLDSGVYIGRDKIEIRDLAFYGYNTKLKGNVNLNTKKEAYLNVALEGTGLDVHTLMQDVNVSDKLLSGKMDVKVEFDNRKEDFLIGDCRITEGTAKLDLVANILRLPSLKMVNFDLINCRFSISKGIVSMDEMKLSNPDITLDSHWNTNGKIEGVLNLKVSSGLLSESKPFKKLLNLTQTKKPYIDFSFLLGGIPKTVRAMWVKGEFKDKIKEGLPAWIRRRIERELDSIVDELSGE